MALELWNGTANLMTWAFGQSLSNRPIMISGAELDHVYNLEVGLATQICKTVFENSVARVTIEVAKPTVLRVEKRKKASFPDQLGTVGGTIGLFTGLSLISVVEMIYWMYLTVVAYLSANSESRKRERNVKSAGWVDEEKS